MFDDPAFIEKMATLERRYEEIANLLGQPAVIAKRSEFMKLSKEHSDLDERTVGPETVIILAEQGWRTSIAQRLLPPPAKAWRGDLI